MSARKTVQKILAISITASLVAACGGGDDEVTIGNNPPPPPIQTSASQGNLGFYAGMWRSDCGFLPIPSGGVQSVINTYTFPKDSASPAAGVLEQRQYSDRSCAKALWPSPYSPAITAAVTVKYIRTYTLPTPSGTSPKYAGQADIVEITTSTPGGTPTVETKHVAIDANDVLHITTKDDLSGSALTYTRVQLPK